MHRFRCLTFSTSRLVLLLSLLFLGGCGQWLATDEPAGPLDTRTDEQMLEQGQALAAQGDYAQALVAFEQVLAKNPRNVDAHVGVGDIYQVRGDYEQAADSYKAAKTVDPSNYTATYKLGLMYHLLERVRDAIQEYLAALTIEPNSFEANLNLATAYLQIKQPVSALPYAQKAVDLRPESQPAYVNLGSIFMALGKHHEAIEAFRTASELGDLNPQVAISLAEAHIKIGHFQRAVNTLNSLIRTQPTAGAYERLGYAQFKQGDYDASLEAYRAALELDPRDYQSLNGVGVNLMTKYLRNRRADKTLRDQAIASWQRSLQINPDQQRILDLISRYRKL